MNDDGTKMRPWDDVHEMDEALVANWNSVVRPQDKVYHLGDVVINRKALKTLERLNGDKVLIRGNHDIFKLGEYTQYFRDVRGVHVLDKFILSHIPLHPSSIGRWTANIHGHLHSYRVKAECLVYKDGEIFTKVDTIDSRYFSVCVEQINYTPIPLETVKQLIKEQQQ
jgi:calcineurin-like phosphoesterase family protein